MKHYGDITKLSGYELPVVDCITGGSPCQDLSVAGKRAGLEGERSGLFMEQIRIVKEIREHDREFGRTGHLVRPRFMVWENVPGAFSSNSGKDFQAVLTEIVRIAEPEAPDVPMLKNRKWAKSGCLYDELGRWSIAWRVHDAQFWGVPQRRKRIALVADFGGLAAPEICFEREGVSGYFEKGGTAGKAAAGCTERSTDGTSKTEVICLQGNGIDRADTAGCNGKGWNDENLSYTLNTIDRPAVFDARGNGNGSIVPTITGDHNGHITEEVSQTLNCMHDELAIMTYQNICGTVDCGISKGTSNQLAQQNMFVANGKTVRRLTPTECERLQGFPDGWTDIGAWTDTKGKYHKDSSDSARYKALGNSIALPFWFWLLRRISAQYERPATLGSLFDGIGGFPLCWERCNGKGTAIWASEIEEFPMAVTKRHFPENNTEVNP